MCLRLTRNVSHSHHGAAGTRAVTIRGLDLRTSYQIDLQTYLGSGIVFPSFSTFPRSRSKSRELSLQTISNSAKKVEPYLYRARESYVEIERSWLVVRRASVHRVRCGYDNKLRTERVRCLGFRSHSHPSGIRTSAATLKGWTALGLSDDEITDQPVMKTTQPAATLELGILWALALYVRADVGDLVLGAQDRH